MKTSNANLARLQRPVLPTSRKTPTGQADELQNFPTPPKSPPPTRWADLLTGALAVAGLAAVAVGTGLHYPGRKLDRFTGEG